MIDQQKSQPNRQASSNSSSYQYPITQLQAEQFHFEGQVDFSSSRQIDSDRYTELISDNNGTLDITLIDQGDTVRYLFQISSIPEQRCESNAVRACQSGAALARGDLAEIQIVLQDGELTPGTYPFGDRQSPAIAEVIISSRQLYSDPAHGQLGCQTWGAGALTINRAVYDADGNLEQLDANLFRVCDRTAPFPPALPEDHLSPVEAENIERYTYRASWRCHLRAVESR